MDLSSSKYLELIHLFHSGFIGKSKLIFFFFMIYCYLTKYDAIFNLNSAHSIVFSGFESRF